MNERDLSVVENLMEKINGMEGHNPNLSLLVDTSFTQIAKTNLLLLKGFLDLEGEKGYFVVLDRPHQYMAYLLHMHDINQENIWYIDTVTSMSGEEKVDRDNVNFVDGPFHIDHLIDVFEPGEEKGSRFASIDETDFVLIDNISSMLNYNSIDKVEEFIKLFKKMIDDSSGMLGCFVIDSDSHPELSKVLKEHIETHIDIDDCKEA